MYKVLIGILLMVITSAMGEEKKNHNFTVAKNMDVFTAIYKNLDLLYVDTLDADVTVGNGIRSMLSSLDPYTEYYPASEMKNLKQMLTGKYAGIGALIKKDLSTGNVVIDEPYEGMPADEAGLRKGDVIIAVDDTSMVGKDVSYVSSHLRGNPGTTFKLTYETKRPSAYETLALRNANATKRGKATKKVETKTVMVTRRAIQLPSVPYYGLIKDFKDLKDSKDLKETKIGYLVLTQFTENCARDVRRAMVEMRNKGMEALIFDLRGNGGGSLQEAIKIVNMFVPKGETIVTTQGKIQRMNRVYKTEQEPLDTVMPVVVLVNHNSASASEITAGALQDLDRATIMGTRTYGKGLVQQTVELPHDGSLKLTVSKYYIPSGRCIQAINYKHTGGGYKEHIPDSLTHEFKTRKGRVVRDGGGIKPDIEVKADSLPNIALYLGHGGMDSTEVAFHYVVDYINSHPAIAPAEEFHLTDADYEDFKQRVIKSGFKYDRETSREYKKLVEYAKFEGYYDDAKAEFDALEKKLEHNLERELDNNRKMICQILEQDIVTAYYYQRGAVANMIQGDKVICEAVALLRRR